MDLAAFSRIVRDLITAGGLHVELMLVQEELGTWRVTVRDERHCLVSFDVPKGMPSHVRDAARRQLESI